LAACVAPPTQPIVDPSGVRLQKHRQSRKQVQMQKQMQKQMQGMG
jgi:hypothetical protein